MRSTREVQISLNDILAFIGKDNCKVVGCLDQTVSGVAPIHEADIGDLVFYVKLDDNTSPLQGTKASLVICDSAVDVRGVKDKTLILVRNPRLWFVRVIKNFFPPDPQSDIHPTAIINWPCVEKGKNVKIGPGCTIGFDGFGYERNDEGAWEKFPHYGGVIIEDDVEIGSNTCIDRGTLSDTVIGRGTKIDNLVHIGHNAKVGRNCMITAKCMMGRSIIGDDVWIGPCSSILPGVNVGTGAFIGMGSVVVRDVEEHTLVYGVPARFVRKLDKEEHYKSLR